MRHSTAIAAIRFIVLAAFLFPAALGAWLPLESGMAVSVREGAPVSAKYGIDNGTFQFSVHTGKWDTEAIVDSVGLNSGHQRRRRARTAALAPMLLVGATTFAVAAGEKITVKYDLGSENPKWKFVTGQWVRRASGGRQVLAQTVETQPWAVALLEDQKFADLDVSVRFRPISGKE